MTEIVEPGWRVAPMKVFLMRLFTIGNGFWWGAWMFGWRTSVFPQWFRWGWCMAFGLAVPIALEIVLLVRRLEIEDAIESMEQAAGALRGAMNALCALSEQLDGGSPSSQPENWRN